MNTIKVNFDNSKRILSKNVRVCNNTYETKLNNNDLIIGATGTGKTEGYVKPNMLTMESSLVVSDTKGVLYRTMADKLRERGFQVDVLDFVNPTGEVSYNPMRMIKYDKKFRRYNDRDISNMAYALLPDVPGSTADPFWNQSGRMVLSCAIAYVLEAFEEKEHTLKTVCRVMSEILKSTSPYISFLSQWKAYSPDGFAASLYDDFVGSSNAEKMWSSIKQMVGTALSAYYSPSAEMIFSDGNTYDIGALGREKRVLFLNISDTDHSFDGMINLVYTQTFSKLCYDADNVYNGRLPMPVRIILDDFAAGTVIKDFDKLISVIRSREISVSIVLQSVSQLNSIYTPNEATTLINGCDHIIYLGSNDLDTARLISSKVGKTVDFVTTMPNDKLFVITRGKKAVYDDKILPECNMNSEKDYYIFVESSEEECASEKFSEKNDKDIL